MKCLKLFVLLAATAVSHAMAAGDVDAGKEKSQPCAACHGPDGNSPSGEWPSLAGQGEKYLVEQIQAFKAGDRQNALMAPMVANLSEQDMADLAAYFSAQAIKVGQADPELAEQGERIYRGGVVAEGVPACSGCHGPAGEGVDAAGFPALAGQHTQYLEIQLKAFRAAGRGDLGDNVVKRTNDPQEMMRTVAAKMSDTEIKAVASFLNGLSTEE